LLKRSVNQLTLPAYHRNYTGSVARPTQRGPTMSERTVEDGRSWTSDVLGVVFYSVLVLLLMLLWTYVPA
jgi:hypothetical protein